MLITSYTYDILTIIFNILSLTLFCHLQWPHWMYLIKIINSKYNIILYELILTFLCEFNIHVSTCNI